MVKHQVSSRGNYALTMKQLVTFLLGLTCALPAVSLADELDDVLNDLMNYRLGKRAETNQPAFSTSPNISEAPTKTAKQDSKSAKISSQKNLKSENNSTKATATKK